MRAQFNLDSGRSVQIEEFFFRQSFEGYLEGDSRCISKDILERLPQMMAKIFWDCQAMLVMAPDQEVLPAFTLMAHLQSYECIPGQEPGDYSRLLVAWFAEDIAQTPVQLAHMALRGVDWNQYAENWVD